MINIFKGILTKSADFIATNLKLFITKEINGKLVRIEKKIDNVESKTDKLRGKLSIIEKIVIDKGKEKDDEKC